jgi:hypothetical protein
VASLDEVPVIDGEDKSIFTQKDPARYARR